MQPYVYFIFRPSQGERMWVRRAGWMMPLCLRSRWCHFVLEILITCSKLRFLRWIGEEPASDSTVGIDQIAGTVQISRNQTGRDQPPDGVRECEGVILDAVTSPVPFGAVGVEVPVLGFAKSSS